MGDWDGLHICETCGDAYTTGRLCRSCAQQEMIDNAEGWIGGMETEQPTVAFIAGQQVVISPYANFAPSDRAIDTLIELRVSRTLGVVRRGSVYVTMVDFPGHTGLNVATVQLEPALPVPSSAGELTQAKAEVARAATQMHEAIQGAPSAVTNGQQMVWLLTNVHDAQVDYIAALEAALSTAEQKADALQTALKPFADFYSRYEMEARPANDDGDPSTEDFIGFINTYADEKLLASCYEAAAEALAAASAQEGQP